ncbi:MAG: hypothetical protein AABY07_07880 [Nanoarchaeota archaeon]
MVKIKIQEEKPERDKKKLILPIFIAAIMILSVFGVIIGNFAPSEEPSQNILEYKSIKFTGTDFGWQAKINNVDVTISNSPNDLEGINLGIQQDSFKELSKIYISRDPRKYIRNTDFLLQANLRQIVNVQIACNVDVEECKDLPLKTCKDANTNNVVIVIEESTEDKVNFKDSCLEIKGNSIFISKVVDKLVLYIFGL